MVTRKELLLDGFDERKDFFFKPGRLGTTAFSKPLYVRKAKMIIKKVLKRKVKK